MNQFYTKIHLLIFCACGDEYMQVFLVSGGFNLSFGGYLSSTETLVDGADDWNEVGHLPVAMWDLAGVSLNNNIFMTGEIKHYLYLICH